MKKQFIYQLAIIGVAMSVALTATRTNAAILYFDAPSSNSGTTIANGGVTTVWQQHDGSDFIDFDDSLSSNNTSNTGLWRYRSTGPAANASGTTSYENTYGGDDAAQLRIVFSGLNAADTQEFFVYNMAAGGGAVIAAAISADTTLTGLYGSLTTYSAGGTNVLADGSLGNIGSGDQRVRYSLGTFTGSTSYAFILDDLAVDPGPSERVTIDGLGIETTAIPEPSTLALAALGLFGLIGFGRRSKQ